MEFVNNIFKKFIINYKERALKSKNNFEDELFLRYVILKEKDKWLSLKISDIKIYQNKLKDDLTKSTNDNVKNTKIIPNLTKTAESILKFEIEKQETENQIESLDNQIRNNLLDQLIKK